MKKGQTIFLQVAVVLISIGALTIMLWEPHLEGRNAHATIFQIYFNDPFLVYAYTTSIAFFIALYQAFKLLGYIRQNDVFSQHSIKAVRTIKYCATAIIVFVATPVVYLFIVRPGDDIAGGVAVGLFLIFISIIIATSADIFEKILQSAANGFQASQIQHQDNGALK